MQRNSSTSSTRIPFGEAEMISCLLSERRTQNGLLPAGMCGDPAWEIMLVIADLSLANGEAMLDDVIQHVNAPASTVMRYLIAMTDQGTIDSPPLDSSGKTPLRLTPDARIKLYNCFDKIANFWGYSLN